MFDAAVTIGIEVAVIVLQLLWAHKEVLGALLKVQLVEGRS